MPEGRHGTDQRFDRIEHAEKIGREDRPHRFRILREIAGREAGGDAGIGDDEIDRMRLVVLGDPGTHGGPVPHIDRAHDHIGALAHRLLRCIGKPFRIAADENQAKAGRRIGEGKRLADAARSTGDENGTQVPCFRMHEAFSR